MPGLKPEDTPQGRLPSFESIVKKVNGSQGVEPLYQGFADGSAERLLSQTPDNLDLPEWKGANGKIPEYLSKWDPVKAMKVVESVREGLYLTSAFYLAGFDYITAKMFLALGFAGYSPWKEWYDKLHVAEAECELEKLQILKQASAKWWQAAAWYLERRYPSKWGWGRDRQVTPGSVPIGQGTVNLRIEIDEK